MKTQESNIKKSASLIKKMCGSIKPVAYVISGSGQKKIAESFEAVGMLPFSRLPGFEKPMVKGHSGKLLLCRYKKNHFLIQCGRSHLYEKGSMNDVVFPVILVKQLGLKRLLLLNSAGAVSKSLKTGDIVLISDQINLMFRNALFADASIKGNSRFVPMRPCYEKGFILHMKKTFKGKKRFWKEGVYSGVIGPVYETEAELNMLEKAGADVVGMSTVQEVIMARYLGLEVNGVSVISNSRKNRADHDDVVVQSEKYLMRLAQTVRCYVDYL